MHNTFDKIKLTFDKPYTIIANDKQKRYKLNNSKSFITNGIEIKIDGYNRTRITFSSKILTEDYHKLISVNTIETIFEKINQQVPDLSFDEFLSGYVSLAEVTRDIDANHDPSAEIKWLFLLAKRQWNFAVPKKCKKYKNNTTSFWLISNNVTPKLKEYISIYHKLNELLNKDKRENKEFIDSISNEAKEKLIAYFEGKIRVEVKLKSKKLKQHFKIKERPTLHGLLNSKVPVVKNIIQSVYSPVLQVDLPLPQPTTCNNSILNFFINSFMGNMAMMKNYFESVLQLGDSNIKPESIRTNIARMMKAINCQLMSAPTEVNTHGIETLKSLLEKL